MQLQAGVKGHNHIFFLSVDILLDGNTLPPQNKKILWLNLSKSSKNQSILYLFNLILAPEFTDITHSKSFISPQQDAAMTMKSL